MKNLFIAVVCWFIGCWCIVAVGYCDTHKQFWWSESGMFIAVFTGAVFIVLALIFGIKFFTEGEESAQVDS